MKVKEKIQNQIQLLRTALKEYSDNYAVRSIKGGTETEDMDADEIFLIHEISKDIVPLIIKIGGPEARTDIRICNRIGVEGVAAPMIESPYALKNFIQTMKSLLTPVQYSKVTKSINLETITGYKNLMDIVDSKFFEDLDQVTAARSDLSASMEMIPDDPEVMRITRNIIRTVKEKGKKTSVGGTITKSNFPKIAEEIQPMYINSRHVMVDTLAAMEIGSASVAEVMLSFEIELFELFAMAKPEKAFYYKNRIELNKERIGNRKVLYSIR